MERIAHLPLYGNSDDELEGFRADDGACEVEVRSPSGTTRHRIQPGDRFEIDAEYHFWDNFFGADSSVTLVRADGEKLRLADFCFDMSWGGWLDDKIADELRKLGCEVVTRRIDLDHRKK